MKTEFSRQTTKNTQISNFMKNHPGKAELFLGDGQTHRGTNGETDRQT